MGEFERPNSIVFQNHVIDGVLRYIQDIPQTAGMFSPLPLIEDIDSDTGAFEHDRMYRNSLMSLAYSGNLRDLDDYNPQNRIETIRFLAGHAVKEINDHIFDERQRNAIALDVMDGMNDSDIDLYALLIEGNMNGKADVVDRARLALGLPQVFPSIEVMNCRRFYDEEAMKEAELRAEANLNLLRAAGFTVQDFGTSETPDENLKFGDARKRSKEKRSLLVGPDGSRLVEVRRTSELVLPVEDGNARILPALKSQFLKPQIDD